MQWSSPLPSAKGKTKFHRILMDPAIRGPNSYIFVRPHVMVYEAFQIGEREPVREIEWTQIGKNMIIHFHLIELCVCTGGSWLSRIWWWLWWGSSEKVGTNKRLAYYRFWDSIASRKLNLSFCWLLNDTRILKGCGPWKSELCSPFHQYSSWALKTTGPYDSQRK